MNKNKTSAGIFKEVEKNSNTAFSRYRFLK